MNILFLGNSHTYFHDMPELVARFAEKTCGEKPRVIMLAYSYRDLDWHIYHIPLKIGQLKILSETMWNTITIAARLTL